MSMPHITQAKLREVLHYDPETGVFTWLKSTGQRAVVGARAGTQNPDGYRYISVFCKTYKESRLAWLYVHGWLPPVVDHEDGVGNHNWIKNLRACTQVNNAANSKIRVTNKSGFKGVYWNKKGSAWETTICAEGKRTYLGRFDTPELAHEFRCLAADMLHGEFSNHGTHKCAHADT
jgi:hypothetical protein